MFSDMTNLLKISAEIIELLNARKHTLATFESCTGGGVCNQLTNIPHASRCIQGGLIGYSKYVKIRVGKVSGELINKYGVVSPQVAQAMAQSAREHFHASVTISCTGNIYPLTSPNVTPEVY